MTDFRALCTKLVNELAAWQQADDFYSDGGTIRGDADYDLVTRARAALDEPEGEDTPVAWLYDKDSWFNGNTWIKEWAVTTDKQFAQFKAQPSEPIPLFLPTRLDSDQLT